MRRIGLMVIVAVVFIALISVNKSSAQCCSGGAPMSGNLGMPSADAGTLQLAVNYDFNKLSRYQVGKEELSTTEFSRESNSILFEVGYSFTQRLSADVFFSWIRQKRASNNQTTSGIGDATVLLKYKILSSLNVGLGIKAPLGASDFSSAGVGFPLDLQPGTGAWDQILWANWTVPAKFIREATTFSITSTVRLAGKNDSFFTGGYEVGNEFMLKASLSDRFVVGTLIFDPSIGINYRHQGEDTSFEFKNPNSGGDFIFINPGLSYQITPDLSLQVNASLPVYRNVGGLQVAPTYRLNTGIFYRFNTKKISPI